MPGSTVNELTSEATIAIAIAKTTASLIILSPLVSVSDQN